MTHTQILTTSMTEPRMLTNGRWVCTICGSSHAIRAAAAACAHRGTPFMLGPTGPTEALVAAGGCAPPVVVASAPAGGVEATLAERGARYGDFSDHALIAQQLQDTMRLPAGWERLTPVQKQALTVIADKIARILSGDPNYTDNWHDIQGYAKLAEDRCVT